jgi:TonB-linked SusC/RagA family outer membrane protein
MKWKIIMMAMLCPMLSMSQQATVSGRLVNEQGQPIAGATITIKGNPKMTSSSTTGEWTLNNANANDTIIITAIGYETFEMIARELHSTTTILKRKYNQLDEAVVIAYGTTTRRLNTGNISELKSEDIAKQPVSNPLSTLSGRIPGLVVTQGSGNPGAAIKIEIRGHTSLDATITGNDPLFIIDGVPFAPGNAVISQLRSNANNPRLASEGGISPFAFINPSDIESIEVMKDADATAIYGSRGANGVIFITTKKGAAGRTTASANFYTGFSKVTRTADMLNTSQYLKMRREAFANDNVTPTTSNAPDLLVWDTTRYTDFKKLFLSGTARTTNAHATVSGGNASTQFLLGVGYEKQTTVFPGDYSARNGSLHFSLDHSDALKKFNLAFSGSYVSGRSNMLKSDLSNYINLAPNFPALKDSAGNLRWQEKAVPFTNPLAELLRSYDSKNDNLTTSLLLSYKIISSLSIKLNAGYNFFASDEISLQPRASLDPTTSTLAFSNFANSQLRSWIAEPQAEYVKQWSKLKFNWLAGFTWQNTTSTSNFIDAENYTSDLLLSSVAAAPFVVGSNTYRQYRYCAFFTRMGFAYSGKYILNLSARRDASSRFGPGKQFGNFGSAGAAWIFSNERWVANKLSFLSFGKWRMSYGITGNDQVGDYRFLDSWQNASLTYQGVAGLQPSRLFNPDYSWEVNKKWETALDLGFFHDKVLMSAAYFINRSGNRLINYALPAQTGFTSVLENWDALVENKGLELSLSSENIHSKKFRWTTEANISFPKNKLVSFPGLDLSSYKGRYLEGQSLAVINLLQFIGVDPATGVYKFADLDSNNTINTKDFVAQGNSDPVFYGGLSNSFHYGNWQLDVFLEFRKQKGRNYIYTQSSAVPGLGLNNQPVYVLDRWQKPGDQATVQRYTSQSGTPAYVAASINLPGSGAIFTDASFIRVKNVSLAYNLPSAWISKIKLRSCRLYAEAQNLFTITKYKGADPENQNLYVLPPLRTIAVGLLINL